MKKYQLNNLMIDNTVITFETNKFKFPFYSI